MLANALTISRIVGAAALLAASPLAAPFWAVYAWCGISDMIDGPVARKLGTDSPGGSLLDSVADLAFAAACLLALIPLLQVETWLFSWIVVIILCKVAGYATGYLFTGALASLHTVANKVAGVALFVTVPVLVLTGNSFVAIPACIVATFAAIQEGHFIRTGRTS